MLKTRLWLVLGLLIFSSVAGVFAFFAWVANQPEPPPEIPPTPVAVDFASAAVHDWLAGGGTALPVAASVNPTFAGNDVSFTGYDGIAWVGFEPVTEAGRRFELHRFLLAGAVPRQVTVTVELTAAGPTLASEPSLEPFTELGAPTEAADRTATEGARAASEAARRVVAEWATAYGRDDRARLAELTGDLEDRTYVGVGGLDVAATNVRSVVDGPDGTDLARVQVTYSTGEDTWSGVVSYDVLLVDGSSANPRVVAWGPAGSGPRLERYGNGIAGSDGAEATTTTTAVDPEAARADGS